MRIAVIPTGRMEWNGLPKAFDALFPGHDFYCVPTQREIDEDQVDFPIDGFTSVDVTRLLGKPNNADKLLQRAVAEVVGDRRRVAADMCVILDDVELCNRTQVEVIIEVMREAVARFLDTVRNNSRQHARFQTALQEQVSFHLASPMIESWVFADPVGPYWAGVPNTQTISWQASLDPECFQTTDAVYMNDQGVYCTCWRQLTEKKQKEFRPVWLKPGVSAVRCQHPKAFLSWLCREEAERNCSSYNETKTGSLALQHLDWTKILGRPENQLQYLRLLVADLADRLGQPPISGGVMGKQASHLIPSRNRVLRNL